ncbi:azurin [Brackiella oedipodis]|uniref:azurin n=1 Tax=Brackiella oedipodis TaxID=124225 RepID=UPI00048E4A5F|nr:azurin [Brackiella oedipodis]
MKFNKLALAALLTVAAAPAFAAQGECSATIEGNDAMQYNTKEIVVPVKACPTFKITLKHAGKLPKSAMGHNLVITKKADMQAVSSEGVAAGAGNDYLKSDDDRILVHTKLLGGGEEDTIHLESVKLAPGTDYAFFCTFPGHFANMNGVVKAVDR